MDDFKPDSTTDNIDVDITRLLGVIIDRKRIVVGILLFFIVLGSLYIFLATPVYQASASLEVYTRRPRVISAEEAVIGQDAMSATAISDAKTTLFHKIQNRAVMDKVVKALKQHGDKADLAQKMTGDELRNFVENQSEFEQIRGTHLFSVTTKSSSPEFTALFANTYAEVIVDHIKNLTKQESLEAVRWLQEQIDVYKLELMKNEAKLIAFKQHHNIEGLMSTRAALDQGILSINEDLVRFQTQASVLKDLLARLQSIDISVDAAGVLPSSIPRYQYIQASLQELQVARGKLSELLERYTPQHPDVAQQVKEVLALELKVKTEIARAISTTEEDLNLALSYVKSVTENKESLIKEGEALENKMNDYRTDVIPLQRELDASDSSYKGLLNRIEEARLAADEETSVINIVELADIPDFPIAPNKMLILAVAFCLGLFAGVGSALALDVLQDRVSSVYDIEQSLSQNLLGVIPHIDKKMDTEEMAAITLQDKFSQVSEAFAGVRASLVAQGRCPESGGWVIMVAGATPAEGKTSVSSNLAITMAKMSKKVLLVDGDMRRPKLEKVFNLSDPQKSLMEVLSDKYSGVVAFSLLPCETKVENLHVATGKPIPGVSPTEILETGRLSEFIAWAKSEFDVVIIDTPPLGLVHDAFVFGRMVNDIILVARQNKCRKAVLKQSIAMLNRNKCPLTGIVLNDFSFTRSGGRYHYGTYGYYGAYTSESGDE
jgi:capsular exopolysaccharide synthesis family protein